MDEKYLTIEEAAEMTRKPVGTLRHYRLNKAGPRAQLVGKRLLYRESDVRQWLDAQFEQAN